MKALINGTLREDEYCPVCGEKGHKQFECPTKMRTFKAAGVKCSICGDGSHPTRDCPLKQHTAPGEGVLDSEYDSLMSELSGGGGYSKVGASSGTTNSIGAVVNASSLQCTALKEHVYVVPEAPVKKQTVVHVAPLFIPSANPYTAQPPTLPTYGYQQGQGYPQGYTSQPVAPTPAYGHSHGQLAASSSATYYNYAYPAPSAQAWPYTANPSLTQPQLNHNQAQHIPPPLQPPPPPPPL